MLLCALRLCVGEYAYESLVTKKLDGPPKRGEVRLPYRSEFEAHEIDEILRCFEDHGFALVRQMLSPDILADLKEAVWEVMGEKNPPNYGDNRTTPDFIEHAEGAIRLLDAEPYLELNRRMFNTDELTIHRSFSVLKNAGSPLVTWHRDFHHVTYEEPSEPDEFLDVGDFGFRALWYLDGSYPTEGGLWVLPDSHHDDWSGLEGFEFTAGRKSFHRAGEPSEEYAGFDVPEMLPLFADPGDLVIYSLRAYHAAAPQPEGLRRACAIVLRPTWPRIEVPWEETDVTKRFLASVPERFLPFTKNYVGIDYNWRLGGEGALGGSGGAGGSERTGHFISTLDTGNSEPGLAK